MLLLKCRVLNLALSYTVLSSTRLYLLLSAAAVSAVLAIMMTLLFTPNVMADTYYWYGDFHVEKLNYRRDTWRSDWRRSKQPPQYTLPISLLNGHQLSDLSDYLSSLGVTMTFRKNWVYLSGEVQTTSDKILANTIANSVSGSKGTINAIKIVKR